VVYQDLVRIDKAIAEGSLAHDPVLQNAFSIARSGTGKLHIMGLLSDGGVHSMRSHAEALCRMAHDAGVKKLYVHAFTDGRDTDPRSGRGYLQQFLANVSGTGAQVASIVGRYFAMDRDKRWERVARAYDLLVHGRGAAITDPLQAFDASYAAGTTDEFIPPHVVTGPHGQALTTIAPGDVVICFNFRTDRCREITQALTQQAFPEHGMEPLPLHYVTMTEYDPTYRDVQVLFRKDDLRMTLGEVVARAGKRQVRIAETEKYPHVTFFFSGGREKPFEGEERIMLPSPKVATYDLEPAMSARGIVDAIVPELAKGAADLVVLNFANPDMVGHTGVYEAIVTAVEVTDQCARKVAEAARANGYSCVIIADHGNADKALNPDGTPNTAHSTNPVPVFVLADRPVALRHGILADVAPTVLDLMGMEKPAEMTGSSLIVR
jgi:2,3-bisphosphoglycerate-independent phosphoglycerate mutase